MFEVHRDGQFGAVPAQSRMFVAEFAHQIRQRVGDGVELCCAVASRATGTSMVTSYPCRG